MSWGNFQASSHSPPFSLAEMAALKLITMVVILVQRILWGRVKPCSHSPPFSQAEIAALKMTT